MAQIQMIVTSIMKCFAPLVLLKLTWYLFQDTLKLFDLLWFKAIEMQDTLNTQLSNESPVGLDYFRKSNCDIVNT